MSVQAVNGVYKNDIISDYSPTHESDFLKRALVSQLNNQNENLVAQTSRVSEDSQQVKDILERLKLAVDGPPFFTFPKVWESRFGDIKSMADYNAETLILCLQKSPQKCYIPDSVLSENGLTRDATTEQKRELFETERARRRAIVRSVEEELTRLVDATKADELTIRYWNMLNERYYNPPAERYHNSGGTGGVTY
jgi:hypothetical protein